VTSERALGLRRAEMAARAMTKRFGVQAPCDIRIEAFAAARGIEIVEGGVHGSVARLCWGARPIIRVSEHVTDVAERRWSTGHELGHFVLEHRQNELSVACVHDAVPQRPPVGTRHFEAEANVFAAEALMPRAQLEPRCYTRPSLDVAHAIAKDFTTTLAASAIRFVELTPERCCAAYSEDGKVVWCVASNSFTAPIGRGKRLDPASIAYGSVRGKLDERPQAVRADAWLRTSEDLELVEHSVVVPRAIGVLTLLWMPDVRQLPTTEAIS
jgi:hypothetical protein